MSSTIVISGSSNTLFNKGQVNYNTLTYYNNTAGNVTYTLPAILPQLIVLKTDNYYTQNIVLPASTDPSVYLGSSIRIIKTLVPYPPIPGFPYIYADHWPATISVAGGGWILPFAAMFPMTQAYSFADNKYYLEMIFDGQYWKVCNLS